MNIKTCSLRLLPNLYTYSLDLQNYARMMPVHLTHLYDLKEKDEETWNFLKQNFTCEKTITRFTAIGVDHALEQVNKELKGLGRIKGMSFLKLTNSV